jgi:hypothetical protein
MEVKITGHALVGLEKNSKAGHTFALLWNYNKQCQTSRSIQS